jgi:multidrug efflux pump subunit AcrA (membrane-fusion protein)
MKMDTKKKKRKWPWVTLAIVLTLLLAVVVLIRRAKIAAERVTYESYTVTRGNVTSTITGSGRLQSADTENIDIPQGVAIADVAVSAGDSVRTGDVLATLDTDSLAERAATLSGQLASIDLELSRMANAKTVETVYAPLAGRLKVLAVSVGDDVLGAIAESGALALISTDGLMQLEIATTQTLALSDEVTVEWADGSDTGTVAAKTESGYLITLDDDKAPCGESAKVYSGDALLGEGTLAIHAPASVLATGGTISDIHCDVNDKLTPATKLFTLENGPFTSAYALKFAERKDIAAQLESVLAYLRDPRVLAASDGIVGAVNVMEGTAVAAAGAASASSASYSSSASSASSAASSGNITAFVLYTGGALKMMVSVDELDIESVALGQSATVTLDAFPDEKFAGSVTRISNVGETAKSVATFSVELTLDADARLKFGMNGNATILVDQATDALILPIAAISEDADGAYVYVGDELVKTYITTGLSDGTNAVVTGGLSEGDVVKYASGMTMYETLQTLSSQFRNSARNRGN